MKRFYAAALVPLALAGCGNKPEVKAENASVAQVAVAASKAMRMEPGKWRTEISVDSVDIANVPPPAADMMKRHAGKQTVETCVTSAQAERPPEELLGGNGTKSCRYDRFEIRNGKLDAAMTCQGGASGSGTIHNTISGDFSGSGYDLVGVAKVDTGGQSITTRTKIRGARIGACDGTEG